MTKDEKKAEVNDYLNQFKEIIEAGIDKDLDGDLTPVEMIVLTVETFYRKYLAACYMKLKLEKENEAASQCPEKLEPPEDNSQQNESPGAIVLPFRSKTVSSTPAPIT